MRLPLQAASLTEYSVGHHGRPGSCETLLSLFWACSLTDSTTRLLGLFWAFSMSSAEDALLLPIAGAEEQSRLDDLDEMSSVEDTLLLLSAGAEAQSQDSSAAGHRRRRGAGCGAPMAASLQAAPAPSIPAHPDPTPAPPVVQRLVDDCPAQGRAVLKLQDFLKHLPPEIYHKMLLASRTIALRRTSKTMRAAVEKADAVVQKRGGIQFPDGRGLLDQLNGLSAWCKLTVLRLRYCRLRRTGAVSLAEALASFLSTSLVELDLGDNSIQEGGGRVLAEALRLCTALTSLNLDDNDLGEGGGRTLAEALRLNTTLASLNLSGNALGEVGGRALAEALRLNTTLTSFNLRENGLGKGGGRALA